MRLFLICRSSVNLPDFWCEVREDDRKEVLREELMEAYVNPKTCVQVPAKRAGYRVLDYETHGNNLCFILVQAVPLH